MPPLVEALEEPRHVAILLERERVAAYVAARGEIRGRQASLGEVAAADDEPAVAGVHKVGEGAGLERLGRHEAEIVAGVGCEPGLGVRLRVGQVDEGGHAEVVMKQGDLAGRGLLRMVKESKEVTANTRYALTTVTSAVPKSPTWRVKEAGGACFCGAFRTRRPVPLLDLQAACLRRWR
jgi:hypothetical protein